ncbi:DMT family transporter (plasmid) [Streptomyces sp. NBC_01527]|uniref:DMT family transporter n=1 Tax=unclassified Streptomyces TaxID=2593676 RepID=UPI002E11DF9E|nr:DMT family transporter [Streptomyces sp. NBC_01230]
MVLLVGVTAVWGSTFFVIQESTRRMPVIDFVAARFTVGALVLAVLRPRALLSLNAAGWARGLVLGLALGASYTLQVFGLQYTSATVSAFVTGMFVVFTPLLSALVLRQRITSMTWAGTVLALAGLGLLTLRGFSIGPGELLTLGCALCIALQILGTGAWAAGRDPYGLAFAQMVAVSVGASCAAIPAGLDLVPPDSASWFGVLWTGVLATAAALVIQTWAQTKLSAERVAVIMTLEPAFAALFGLSAGQLLSAQQAIGSVLVLVAMLVVELRSDRSADTEAAATPTRDTKRASSVTSS